MDLQGVTFGSARVLAKQFGREYYKPSVVKVTVTIKEITP
jgi:hypothetical protein